MPTGMEARENFAAELRRLRGNLSLRDLARMACCGKSTVSDLEHERRTPTPRISLALDQALNAGGRLVELEEAHRRLHEHQGNSQIEPGPDGTEDLFEGWDNDVWRRDFLKNAGALGAVSAGLGGSLDIGGSELMEAHTALRAAHGRLDYLRGAASVYTQALDHHQQILAWHATLRTTAEHQRVAALAADTGGFVGFLSWDLGMPDTAATHYRDAAAHARQAGDLSSCANLIGQMSRVHAEQGDYQRALHLADGALRLAGTRAHPAVRCWLHAVRAYHHAGLGSARPARTDLNTAWALLEGAHDGETPPYIGYLDTAEIGKWSGHVMVRLGQTAPAYLTSGRRVLDQTRADWPTTSVRGSAEVLTTCARLHAATGDLDVAHHLVSRSLAIATATGSARNLRTALATRTLITS
ncbi:helix-turn-helix transcriptional regulator [Streptomyces sp. NPDC088124]|uniref:helix-turn-helix domain-containing protein n=1 Tax=Streptomyces sp. NPDC088124 TaxID=3154654 RepID=UPI0034345593